MEGVELPTEWAVARNNTNKATPAQQQRGSKRSRSGGAAPAAAAAADDHLPTSGPSAVVAGLLGPRGVFDVTAQEAPERGQVREMVLASLRREPLTAEGGEEALEDIEVDCLLCRLPYKKMLSDLFGGDGGGGLSAAAGKPPQIPYVTRAYEEAFMREVMHAGERKCAKGPLCECMFIDAEQPFVGVEFLLPGERQPQQAPHMCVLCCRAVTQQLYYDVMFDKQDFGGVIQRFGNIHSQPGEYALNAMLIAAPTAPVHIMPLPIVSHQRNRYTTFLQGGIKHLKQSRVYFQSTPSC